MYCPQTCMGSEECPGRKIGHNNKGSTHCTSGAHASFHVTRHPFKPNSNPITVIQLTNVMQHGAFPRVRRVPYLMSSQAVACQTGMKAWRHWPGKQASTTVRDCRPATSGSNKAITWVHVLACCFSRCAVAATLLLLAPCSTKT